MALGDVIQPTTVQEIPVAFANRMGPETAMTKALAAYLETIWWYVDGGDNIQDSRFRLTGADGEGHISEEWPSANDPIDYPTASIIEVNETEQGPSNFVPTPFEETWGEFDALIHKSGLPGKTVLWKEAEAKTTFQVDFWLNGSPDRKAVEAGLSAVFSPGESRYGVLLEGPELYYRRPMRFTLMGHRKDDTKVTAFVNERRLRCTVIGECDIVSLRMAHQTTIQPPCIEVTDPTDLPLEE